MPNDNAVMNSFFKDYRWIKGKPVGFDPLTEESRQNNDRELNFKIVVDPYFKRYTIEQYFGRTFQNVVYDSLLLDFRKISPQEQTAWERQFLEKSEHKELAIIRDIHDRIILKEEYLFQEGLCRSCLIFSPQGWHLATQKIFYRKFGDPFNGVHLYDLLDHLVIEKKYQADEEGNFLQLLE